MANQPVSRLTDDEKRQLFEEALKEAKEMPEPRRRAILASFAEGDARAKAIADGSLSPLWA